MKENEKEILPIDGATGGGEEVLLLLRGEVYHLPSVLSREGCDPTLLDSSGGDDLVCEIIGKGEYSIQLFDEDNKPWSFGRGESKKKKKKVKITKKIYLFVWGSHKLHDGVNKRHYSSRRGLGITIGFEN